MGWKGTGGGISTQTVVEWVLAGLQPGEIILVHIGSNPDDGSTLVADALLQMIDGISAAGYGFVTLDAPVRKTAYREIERWLGGYLNNRD